MTVLYNVGFLAAQKSIVCFLSFFLSFFEGKIFRRDFKFRGLSLSCEPDTMERLN